MMLSMMSKFLATSMLGLASNWDSSTMGQRHLILFRPELSLNSSQPEALSVTSCSVQSTKEKRVGPLVRLNLFETRQSRSSMMAINLALTMDDSGGGGTLAIEEQ